MQPVHFESLYPPESRFKEIEKILQFVREGNSSELIGMPGSGKSNVLNLLCYNRGVREKHLGEKETSTHFVMVNFSEIRNRGLFDAMKFVFLSLTDSFRERKLEEEYEKTNEIFREVLKMQDELVIFQGLKRAIDYLALEKKWTIVFLFNRFDEYIPQLTSEFFANMRVLRNRAKYQFSIVFSLRKPLEDMIEPEIFTDYHELMAGHIVYVNMFDKPGIEFRVSYIQKLVGKKISEKAYKMLFSLTSGHVKLTRLSAEAILATEQEFGKEVDLATYLMKQKTVHGALVEIWKGLSPAEQKYILNAKGRRQRAESSNENVENTSTDYLESIGLVKSGRVAIPLFESFVDVEVAAEAKAQEKIVFDEATNAIVKGAISLSDSLTASEYRLLKFLLANQEKVLDRDEIIGIVWQGDKSTAGVTDQALDQLIFRLRKKIEDDPNQPIHLQTVKGRGFKFIP